MQDIYWDKSFWRYDDKVWLAERKKQWQPVQKNLKIISQTDLKGPYIKHHKELFFKGTVDEALWRKDGDDPFGFMLPIFVIWYHPDPAQSELDKIMEYHCYSARKANCLCRCTAWLNALSRYENFYLKTPYNMFGGREELMMNFFFSKPGDDPKVFTLEEFYNGNTSKHIKRGSFTSPHTYTNFWDSQAAIMLDGEKNRFSAHQYMEARGWGNVVYWQGKSKEKKGGGVVDLAELKRAVSKSANFALFFEQNSKTDKNHPLSLAKREELLKRYREEDFPEIVMDMWREEEKLAKPRF